MEKKWIFALVAVIAVVAVIIVGTIAPREELVTIRVAGSTSVFPVAEALALEYMDANPHIRIIVGGGGTGAGITQAREGVIDIGMASRELRPEELGWGLHGTTIMMDGIVVIVHLDNPVRDLTVEQIRRIYMGEITNWREVGGADAAINVVTREEGSGTRDAFEDVIMDDEDIFLGAMVQGSTGAVKAMVAGDRLAIGYISFAALDETIRALSIGGVRPTIETMKPGGGYPIARPFLFVTKGPPEGAVNDFIVWVLGEEGQRIVVEEDGIPVK
jgi:phosphate transport system substrate-binding protein